MITLGPLAETDFQAYLEKTRVDYAEEKVKAGNWPAEEATELSRQEFSRLLPQGLESENQHLFSIDRDGQHIGVIWFATYERPDFLAFILDFVIHPEHRGQGYGKAALRAVEDQVRAVGRKKISLHVFAHNTSAIELYKKMGYEITNINMAKALE